VGKLNPADEEAHEKGLQWLAKCSQLRKENMGEKPMRDGSREELVDVEAMTFEATWSGLFMTIIEPASDSEPDKLNRTNPR
jgi:hypothetical protein